MGYLDDKGLGYLWEKIKARSTPVKPVTQAQYEALPEAQKNADVMYLVTDGGSSGGGDETGGSIPPGGIIIWSGAEDAVPDGWALCDGTNGTPDLRDRFVLGAGNRPVGEVGGEETHKLTLAEMPRHQHDLSLYSRNITGTINVVNAPTGGVNGTMYTGSSGSGSAHNNMPPYYVLCYIMKL